MRITTRSIYSTIIIGLIYVLFSFANANASNNSIELEDPPATPDGFVVFDTVGDDPVDPGELFLAAGPNDVETEGIEYRLFYSLTADQPADPLDATEYSFGSTPGDGDGVNPFGFVLGGLEPGTEYTFWLYQYNSAEDLYSDPAVATAVSGGEGDTEPIGDNIVLNGNFAEGLDSWEPFIADFEGVSADVAEVDGEAAITNIAGAGGEVWHVQLNQILTSGQIDALDIGSVYTIEFDARSNVDGRQLRLYFGEDGGGFVPLIVEDTVLTESMTTHGFSFEVTQTFDAMKLGFELGLSNDDVYIDNVSLVRTGDSAPQAPAQPQGFVASDMIGENPVDDGELFLAAGPNNVQEENIQYRLFYSLSSDQPADPRDAAEYPFGTTPGDGEGINPFGFVIGDLEPGAEYTFWLYQYNSAEELFSEPAVASAVSGGGDEFDLVRLPLPVDFEDESIDWNNVFLGFEGAFADRVENPAPDDVNDSQFVGRSIKDADIYWAGQFFLTEESFWFDEENNTITMDVWSPRSNVGINLKLEQSDGSAEYDSFAITSTSEEWETMTWEYSGASPLIDWDQITLIFDFNEGQNGDGGFDWTWYFDNIDVNFADPESDRPVGPATPEDLEPIALPLDFEDGDFDWDFAFFGFEGGNLSRVENPDIGDDNSSEWVGRMVKGSGPFWAGAFMHINDPFTIDEENHFFSMKVWSPAPNVPILMKVEQQDGDLEYEITQNTSTSEEWEIMTWDMSGAGFTDQWDVVVLIFDFREGGEGDGSENSTWFIDDLEVNVEGVATSNEEVFSDAPAVYNLHQNFPNPFNPTTQIQFDVPEQADLTLEVFNITGQRVAVLANSTYRPGRHTVTFDASNLASGIYFYRLHSGSFVQTEKMMLIK